MVANSCLIGPRLHSHDDPSIKCCIAAATDRVRAAVHGHHSKKNGVTPLPRKGHILGSQPPPGDTVSDELPEAPPPTAGSAMDISALSAAAYDELRRLARGRLRSSGPLTLLDTVGLVSDTYQRLALQHNLHIESRAHFLGYCSRIMRSVIIDLVREKNAERRGGRVRTNHPEHGHRENRWRAPTNHCASTRRWRSLQRENLGWRKWLKCGISAATTREKSLKHSASPPGRCSETGKRPGCCCGLCCQIR